MCTTSFVILGSEFRDRTTLHPGEHLTSFHSGSRPPSIRRVPWSDAVARCVRPHDRHLYSGTPSSIWKYISPPHTQAARRQRVSKNASTLVRGIASASTFSCTHICLFTLRIIRPTIRTSLHLSFVVIRTSRGPRS